jgi:hypothetical protein
MLQDDDNVFYCTAETPFTKDVSQRVVCHPDIIEVEIDGTVFGVCPHCKSFAEKGAGLENDN